MTRATHFCMTPVPPSYGISQAVPRRANAAHPARPTERNPLCDAFARARPTRSSRVASTPALAKRDRLAPGHVDTRASAWSAAFALMLVANLAAPTQGALPRPSAHREENDHALGVADINSAPVDTLSEATTPTTRDDVAVRPIEHEAIRTHYTPVEVLRSIAAGNAPFEHLGEFLVDLYALLTGHEVSRHTRDEIHQSGRVLDAATGLIPEVAVLRMPSDLAEMIADALEGKPISSDRLIAMLQNVDPHVLTRPLQRAWRPAMRGKSRHLAAGADTDAPSHAVNPRRVPQADVGNPHPKRVSEVQDKRSSGIIESVVEVIGTELDDAAPGIAPREVSHALSPVVLSIVGEREHLAGYEQRLDPALPPDAQRSPLVLVDGRHYLRGEAGYYRASRGQDADQWLIDAPRRDRAQVPVSYDRRTGQWEARAPLRLCGGGCGSSRGTTPDSIAVNRHEIDAILSHLRDEEAQAAILSAYGDMAALKLKRTNRHDLRAFRDYTIVQNRVAIQSAIRNITPNAPIFEQQRLAAVITSAHYRLNPNTEAFCHENAEILFHFLVENGIDGNSIRMITVHPEGNNPHVLVLYTESDELIDALELSTPAVFDGPGVDGITGENFAGLIMDANDRTLLLDPWSRVKAVGFAMSKDPQETARVLDAAFVDIGQRPGNPYMVSLTRPLGPRRSSVPRRISLGSAGAGSGSEASSSGGSSGRLGSTSSFDSVNSPGLANLRRDAPAISA